MHLVVWSQVWALECSQHVAPGGRVAGVLDPQAQLAGSQTRFSATSDL